MIQCRPCQMLVQQVRWVPEGRNGQWGIRPAVQEVRAEQEVAGRPSKDKGEGMGVLRVALMVLHPSEERLEVRVVPQVDQGVQVVDLRLEALAELHPSEEQRGGLEEMLGVHWGVGQGVLQKHREVELKMADLVLQEVQEVLLVDPVGLLPSVVPLEAQEWKGEDLQQGAQEGKGGGLQQGAQAVQGPVPSFQLRRHLQPILVLPQEGLLPLPWPPIDAPILWRRYHRSRLNLRPP